MRRLGGVVIVMAMVLLPIGCSDDASPATSTAASGVQYVLAVDNEFRPQSLTVPAGTEVVFENTGRRHPRARYGRFDVYNNYLYRWHAYDWFYLPPYRDSYGSWCQSDCQMRLENNVYEKTIGAKDLGTNANDAWRCTEGGKIVQSGAFVTSASTAPLGFGTGCPANPTVFARPYAATIEPADAMLGTKLFMQTGN